MALVHPVQGAQLVYTLGPWLMFEIMLVVTRAGRRALLCKRCQPPQCT